MAKKTSRVLQESTAAAIRAEDEARLGKIYGALLPDVLLLRSRGFTIVKERGQLLLGGRPTTAEDLQAKAARERRLLGVAQPITGRQVVKTAGGLEVGAVVSLNKRSATGQVPLSAMKEKLTGAALAAKARSEATSQDLGPPPRMEWVQLDQLTVDRRYQRDMGKANWAHANRILREWNWLNYQPIVVAPHGEGGFVVIDGQHRFEAARKHPLIEALPCYIVDAADVAQQAQAFVALNARRIGVTRLQRFWAGHAAGDTIAKRIHRICADAGVQISRSGGVLPPRTTFATFTIEKLLPLGGGNITEALRVLVETHGDTPDVFKSAVIFALVQIVAEKPFIGPLRDRLVKVLKTANLDALLGEAKSWRAQHGGTMEKALERALRVRYVGLKAAA